MFPRNIISFCILALLHTGTTDSANICIFESLLDGGVLTAHAVEEGRSGPGNVYVEPPKLDSFGNYSLTQQWLFYNMGHGDLYFVARENPNNEMYTNGTIDLIWNEHYSSSFGAYQLSSKEFGRCLENTGLGQRINTLALCYLPDAPNNVWNRKCTIV